MRKHRYWLLGLSAAGLFLLGNAWQVWSTREAFGSDGLEVWGWPLWVYRRGGFSYFEELRTWAIPADIMIGLAGVAQACVALWLLERWHAARNGGAS